MIINRNYILEQVNFFIQEKQSFNCQSKNKNDKLFDIKMAFPKWIRNIVFHPFNPVYAVYLQIKQTGNKQNKVRLDPLHIFAVDFFEYILNNPIQFDTNVYYNVDDQKEIETFISNRIKSLIPGYSDIPMTKEMKDMFVKRKMLDKSVKAIKDGYVLNYENDTYFLPSNSFQEPIFIHHYGLKYLPESITEYIQGKDFLDIGAFLGDTSIFLLKKYQPKNVYAYEPVSFNLEQLKQTIKGNTTNKVIPIQKGMGAQEGFLDIHINPQQLSACSINENLMNTQLVRESIEITTIDKECLDKKVGLIKMDIEGAEYSAIKGGLETIKRDKPVLLISLYHTAKDFFEIPPMLKEIVPDYQFRFVNIEVVNPFSEKILIAYPTL